MPQGHCKMCHGRTQQCWSESECRKSFQTLSRTTGIFGKSSSAKKSCAAAASTYTEQGLKKTRHDAGCTGAADADVTDATTTTTTHPTCYLYHCELEQQQRMMHCFKHRNYELKRDQVMYIILKRLRIAGTIRMQQQHN